MTLRRSANCLPSKMSWIRAVELTDLEHLIFLILIQLILSISICDSFWFSHFLLVTVSDSVTLQLRHFSIMTLSDLFTVKLLTLSNFDTSVTFGCVHFPIQTFSPIQSLSNSYTLLFWNCPILTLSNSETLRFSLIFQLWHFLESVSLSNSDTLRKVTGVIGAYTFLVYVILIYSSSGAAYATHVHTQNIDLK